MYAYTYMYILYMHVKSYMSRYMYACMYVYMDILY